MGRREVPPEDFAIGWAQVPSAERAEACSLEAEHLAADAARDVVACRHGVLMLLSRSSCCGLRASYGGAAMCTACVAFPVGVVPDATRRRVPTGVALPVESVGE